MIVVVSNLPVIPYRDKTKTKRKHEAKKFLVIQETQIWNHKSSSYVRQAYHPYLFQQVVICPLLLEAIQSTIEY